MLSSIIGSENSEYILVFILKRDEGYAREIARFFDATLSAVQQQLDKLEAGGVLVSKKVGRTRVYEYNPRYPFLTELKALLEKAYSFYPEDVREKLEMNRRRPRKKGKPL
jgi:predicted ArsR family transcriptional regulator